MVIMSGLLDLSDLSEIWIENPSYRVFGDWKRRFHSLYIGSFFGWGGDWGKIGIFASLIK
jgi:hypothetical protein